jgi:plastocyanin
MKRRDFLRMILIGSGAAAFPRVVEGQGAGIREFQIKLKRYKFTPSVISVNQGDRVRLTVEGLDLEHGLYIDGYDIDVKVRHAEAKTLEFTADRSIYDRETRSGAEFTIFPFSYSIFYRALWSTPIFTPPGNGQAPWGLIFLSLGR